MLDALTHTQRYTPDSDGAQSYSTLSPALSVQSLSHKPKASSKVHGIGAWVIVKVKVTAEDRREQNDKLLKCPIVRKHAVLF